MLLPEQVAPFLQHDDPIVREHALSYFHDSYRFGPLTADDCWAVIDRLGENDSTRGFAAALYHFPQTEASVDRLFSAASKTSSRDFKEHYLYAVQQLDLALLQRHHERVRSAQLSPAARRLVDQRLSLADTPPRQAWGRLMDAARDLGDAYEGEFDSITTTALTEAAARGDSAVCEHAVAALGDWERYPWCSIFAARVLGLARYEPAIEALVNTMMIDTDLLCEDACLALARIGTSEVVDRIVGFYPGKPWHARLYAHGPLSQIKSAASERGLLTLLRVELALDADPDSYDEDEPVVDDILLDFSQLCSLAGLDESRRRIEQFPDDPELLDICERLLATATMIGATLPEEVTWRKRVERQRRRSRASEAYFRSALRDADQPRHNGAVFANVDTPPPIQAEPVKPIRNATPKVGRNDPCPCGSGKKYKKCCGK